MAQWTYVGVETSTGKILADLPIKGARPSRVLNGHGSLSGTIDLRGVTRPDDVVDAVDGGRRAIYALVDGVPVWGGPSWADPDDGADVISVSAGEWGSYFARRKLRADLTYTGVDQLVIARGLIGSAQSEPFGNVGVTYDTAPTSGVLRDRTYLAGDNPVVGELLADLGNVDGGFDWAWPVEWADSTHLRGRLELGYPRIGLADADAQYVLTLGEARSITLDRSAADMATTSWAVGKPENDGDPVPVASAEDTALLDAGYPLLDRIERYQDVSDTGTLLEHAVADQQAAGGALVSVQAEVPIGDVLGGAVGLGDPVRVERFTRRDGPDGLLLTLRCTGYELDPEGGVASLTLSPRVATGGRVPRREDVAARLARINREVRLLTVSR
jgi:hypothetical protein